MPVSPRSLRGNPVRASAFSLSPVRSSFLSLITAGLFLGLSGCDLNDGGQHASGELTVAGLGSDPMPPLSAKEGIPLAKGAGPDIFRADFENQASSCWGDRLASGFAKDHCDQWGNIGPSGVQLAAGKASRSGRQSLAVTFDKNESVAGATLTLSADTVNVRAYYNFGEGFDFGQGIKVGRIRSFDRATQANEIDIIMTVRSSGDAGQCGLTDMADLGLFYNGKPAGRDWGNLIVPAHFERGRWYAVEYQVALNRPGARDGSVRIWVDGVLKGSKGGLDIRGNTRPGIKLNKIMMGGWYSNSALGNPCADPSQPSTVYIDDVVVGTEFTGLD